MIFLLIIFHKINIDKISVNICINQNYFFSHITYRENFKRVLDSIEASGINWVRANKIFHWPNIEKSPGIYDWRITDSVVIWAQERGLNIIVPFFWEVPEWAYDTSIDDKNIAAYYIFQENFRKNFENFYFSIAERYDFDGKDDMKGLKYAIIYFEMWNEANEEKFLGTPEDFVRLFKIASKNIKKANKKAKIMGPCLNSGECTDSWIFYDKKNNRISSIPVPVDWKRKRWLYFYSLILPNIIKDINAVTCHFYYRDLTNLHIKDPQLRLKCIDTLILDNIDTLYNYLKDININMPLFVSEVGIEIPDTTVEFILKQQKFFTEICEGLLKRKNIFVSFHAAKTDISFTLINPDFSTRPAWKTLKDYIRKIKGYKLK